MNLMQWWERLHFYIYTSTSKLTHRIDRDPYFTYGCIKSSVGGQRYRVCMLRLSI
jgi:hypothetical protein